MFDVRFSEDYVTEVVGIHKPLLDSIYREFRDLLARHGTRISKQSFKTAMRQGQLTCHFGAYSWPRGEYTHPAGRYCVNNLLLTLPPPSDPDHLLAFLNITLDTGSDPVEAVAATAHPEEYYREELAASGRDAATRLVDYGTRDELDAIWQDPCLVAELESYLNEQKVYVLPNAEFKALKAGCVSPGSE